MPAVVVAAGATAIASAIVPVAWGAFATALMAGGLALIGNQLLGVNARPRDAGFKSEAQDRQVMLRSAIEPRRIVYGEVGGLSGPLSYATVSREYGSQQVQENHVVPPAAPFTVAAQQSGYLSTVHVVVVVSADEAGETLQVLTAVGGSPGANEYSVSGGTYTFHSSRAGQSVRVLYDRQTSQVLNSFLHLVIPLAGHQVQDIGDVELGADTITSAMLDSSGNVVSGKYAHYVRIRKYLGTADQTADAALIAESGGQWTAAHRGRGVAYIYVRLRRNPELFPDGVPAIRAKVKGALLYDTRTGLTAWSNNWALVVYDYLTKTYGLGCAASEISSTLLNAAANAADEDVTIDAVGTTQKRYTADGTVNLADRPLDILKRLLTAGAGTAVYSVSTWDVYAGVYAAPMLSLTVSDLRGPIAGRADLERRDLFNGVRGTFADPARGWQPTDFPPVKNATYVAEDNGEEILRDIELPFTADAIRAQRIAKIFLERARQSVQCVWPAKPKLFRVNTMQTVDVTVAQLGWSAKVFRVLSWGWQPGGGVDLTLQEDAAAIYNWAFGEATKHDLAPNTTLPNAGPVAPPGTPVVTEALVEANDQRNVEVQATITCQPSTNAYVERYQFEYKLASAGTWTVLPAVSVPSTSVRGLAAGVYDWRVAAINALGQKSLYSQSRKEIIGLAAAPADVANFSVRVISGQALAIMDQAAELDVRIGGRLILRHSALTIGAAWNDGYMLNDDGWPGDSVAVFVPLLPGTYLAKWRDSSGNYSANAASFVATEAHMTGFTALATATEHPAFLGTKTSVAAVDSALQLDGTSLIDSWGLLDDQGQLDAIGGLASAGTYLFANRIDLGSVLTVRLFPTLKTLAFDTADLWDSRTNNIDSWGLVDGNVIEDAEVSLEVRSTNDNPTGSPVWGSWHKLPGQADYNARAFEFRMQHTSGNVTHNRKVSELSVVAKQPT